MFFLWFTLFYFLKPDNTKTFDELGNFVLYRFGNPPALWCVHFSGLNTIIIEILIVLYFYYYCDVYRASNTLSPNALLVVQPEDGNMVIYDSNGTALRGFADKVIDPSVLPTHLHLQGIVEG